MNGEADVKTVEAPATGSLADQVADLISDDVVDFPVDEPIVESSQETPPAGETPSGDSESDGENTGEPVVPVAVVEQPSGELSEIDALKGQIASLTKLVNDLSGAAVVQPTKTEPELNLTDLIESVDFDEIMESKEKFMEFFTTALKTVQKTTTDYVSGVVPDVVVRQTSMQEVAKSFYDANPELVPVKQYVATIATNIAKENPDWQVQQVLEEAAKVSKMALNIQPATPANSRTSKPPTLPGGNRSVRTPQVSKDKLQSEIDDLITD